MLRWIFVAGHLLLISLALSMRLTNAKSTTSAGLHREINLPLKNGVVNGEMAIVDQDGKRVKLACTNWYGAHMEDMVVNGLDRAPLANIVARIKEFGFNCVRLPYALDTLFLDPVVKKERLSLNQELIGLTAMKIFDRVIQELTDAGLMVIINNHISKAMWCCSLSDGEGLWYTDDYPEEIFFDHWTIMAERYLDNPLVVGAELRNEIRIVAGSGGEVNIPKWGWGENRTDWKLAAEKAAVRIHEVNKDILIIVGGTISNALLAAARAFPIKLPNQEKLVYTGHMYEAYPLFSVIPFWAFDLAMYEIMGFVTEPGHSYSGPLWLGEFGTNTNGSNYWPYLIQFLEKHDVDFGYWSLDGYKQPGQDETYGLLLEDFYTVRHDWKLDDLRRIMPILSK